MSAADISERDLTTYVRDAARALGWRRYHTWLAKHSPAGRSPPALQARAESSTRGGPPEANVTTL